ncbi:transposase [Asticcacaulis excentricus]|uniref:transposase n=1 Tax=Asticcacaulis excentricus TaxID=78587 RepID=UPI0026A658DD
MGRYEVISGVERYRRRSREEKALILREASVPGAIVSHVARRHDVRPQQIYQWRRQLQAAEGPIFVPVSVGAS